MSSRSKQTLWITSISPKEVYGQKCIPTAINYKKTGSVIGQDAFLESGLVNQNFKVDLGDVPPGGSVDNRRKFETNIGEKSAFELTKDFFSLALKDVEDEYPRTESNGFKHPAKVIVAEPLSFQVEGHSGQWLTNYRENIRRILNRYEQVEFLPEPFAVYQYYRYGLRLPTLQDKTKQIALIIDFGGGTFDACIIESTKSGDISQTGKNSKPLSAVSISIGGFFVNRQIAIYLIKRHIDDKNKSLAEKYISQYERVLKGSIELSALRDEGQIFIRNILRLEDLCERYKLDLVSKLSESDWSLDVAAYQKVLISVPKDPFNDGDWVEDEFYAHNLRDVFIKKYGMLILNVQLIQLLNVLKRVWVIRE